MNQTHQTNLFENDQWHVLLLIKFGINSVQIREFANLYRICTEFDTKILRIITRHERCLKQILDEFVFPGN